MFVSTENLFLSFNQFTGTLTSNFGTMAALQSLNVENNDLEGNLMDTVEGLLNLRKFFFLSDSAFVGSKF